MSGAHRVLAVAGPKGSPGVSTVAIGLALELAGRGLETLLVDADAEDGSLGLRLEVDEEGDPRPLVRAGAIGALQQETVLRAAVRVAPRLALLEAAGAEAESIAGEALVAACSSGPWQAVVVDLGHRFGALQGDVVRHADWLLWVVAGDRLGLLRGDRALGGSTLAPRAAGLVVNRADRAARSAGRELAQRHGLPLMAVFGSRAAGGRWGWRRGPNRGFGMAGGFRALARSVHPSLLDRSAEGVWP